MRVGVGEAGCADAEAALLRDEAGVRRYRNIKRRGENRAL